jgi:hypothetical protein
MAAVHHPKYEIHKHPTVRLSIISDPGFHPIFNRLAASADKSRPQVFLDQLWEEANALREQFITEDFAKPLPDFSSTPVEATYDADSPL